MSDMNIPELLLEKKEEARRLAEVIEEAWRQTLTADDKHRSVWERRWEVLVEERKEVIRIQHALEELLAGEGTRGSLDLASFQQGISKVTNFLQKADDMQKDLLELKDLFKGTQVTKAKSKGMSMVSGTEATSVLSALKLVELNGSEVDDPGNTTPSDAGVVPFGVARSSAGSMLRAAFEHKQAGEDKEDYLLSHPEQAQRRSSQPTSSLWARCRGQAVTELIGAHFAARIPLVLCITDGRRHTLLRLRGSQLLIYEDLTPTQAYWMLADTLKSSIEMRVRKEPAPEDLSSYFSDEAIEPLRTLKRKLGGDNEGPLEQIDSLTSTIDDPAQRLAIAHELMGPWVSSLDPILPAAVMRMYA